MKILLDRFFAVLTFRAGPQDLPVSPAILTLLLAMTLVLDVLAGKMVQGSAGTAHWIIVRMIIGLFLLWLLLRNANKSARFMQTAIALTLVTLVATLISFPIILAMGSLPTDPKSLTGTQAGAMLLMFPVFIWFLCARTAIFRSALENHWLSAFLLALGLLLAEAVFTVFLMKLVQ